MDLGLTPEGERVCDAALALLTARGPLAGASAEEQERHRVRLAWAIRNDRWTGCFAADGTLLGWLGWLRTNGRGARLLRRLPSAEALVAKGRFPPSERGSYLFITDAAVAPDAPAGTLRTLVRQAVARNPQARRVCARIARRPVRTRWREGRIPGRA